MREDGLAIFPFLFQISYADGIFVEVILPSRASTRAMYIRADMLRKLSMTLFVWVENAQPQLSYASNIFQPWHSTLPRAKVQVPAPVLLRF